MAGDRLLSRGPGGDVAPLMRTSHFQGAEEGLRSEPSVGSQRAPEHLQVCYELRRHNSWNGEAMSSRIDQSFWFEHTSGKRLFPYKLEDRRSKQVAFRVAPPGTGANRTINQTQLDKVEQVRFYVFSKGWSVRMISADGTIEGLYNKNGYSIVSTSERAA